MSAEGKTRTGGLSQKVRDFVKNDRFPLRANILQLSNRPLMEGAQADLTGKTFLAEDDRGERKEKVILEIRVHDDNIEKAIKDLKRQLQKEGLFKEIKKRSFYEKPSVKDRRKRREAQKRRMKAQRRKSFYD